VVRVYLPPDANCLLSVADHCLRSRDYVNLIVIDKQPELQYLDIDAARAHCARGASVWDWASAPFEGEPDIVMACAGDIPTLEALAATALLREWLPALRVRFVNVVDLMTLVPSAYHPHGLDEEAFRRLFTDSVDVVFAFHGYARALHQLLHGRPDDQRFHVHGFIEQGTTTTPFDMVVLNEMSRYHLVLEALRRLGLSEPNASALTALCHTMLERHHSYIRAQLEDLPEIRDWVWPF
jgi:xylulose-5-phosphate/fructose-6-phosphate phosphoketolase